MIEWKEHPVYTNYLIQNGGLVKNILSSEQIEKVSKEETVASVDPEILERIKEKNNERN